MQIPVATIDVKWPKSHPLEKKICFSKEIRILKACLKNFHGRYKALTETFYLPSRIVLPKQKHNLEPQTKAKFISENPCPAGENNWQNNTYNIDFSCDQHSWESSCTNSLERSYEFIDFTLQTCLQIL